MAIDTKRTSEIITKLKTSTGQPEDRLSDQNVAQLGTNRISEIRAEIGDTGEPFEKLYNDYIDGL